MVPPDLARDATVPEQRADREAMVVQFRREFASGRGAVEHCVECQMRRRRPIPTSELQLLDSQFGGGRKQVVEGQRAEAVGDHADMHRLSSQPHFGDQCAQMREAAPRIGKRWRLDRVLFRLDNQPAAIAGPGRTAAGNRPPVARHGKDAVEHGIESRIGASDPRENFGPDILAMDMVDATAMAAPTSAGSAPAKPGGRYRAISRHCCPSSPSHGRSRPGFDDRPI
jgi:hypothetical protein